MSVREVAWSLGQLPQLFHLALLTDRKRLGGVMAETLEEAAGAAIRRRAEAGETKFVFEQTDALAIARETPASVTALSVIILSCKDLSEHIDQLTPEAAGKLAAIEGKLRGEMGLVL